jgi:large subunit ribosomal protein L23
VLGRHKQNRHKYKFSFLVTPRGCEYDKSAIISMQSCFRRLYSSIPDVAATARTASTPRAVRLRRLRKCPTLATAETDATSAGLTPTEFSHYQHERAKGELVSLEGKELTESEWIEKLNSRRNRLRGIQEITTKDGDKQTKVVGQKIYLPNVIFRMVRNFTPPGKPYNPYEATFRVPQSITKTDVRSYLAAVYGVKTTYIRTDNYLSPYKRTVTGWVKKRKVYKRAVVGLEDPFYYPQAIEDMNKAEREQRIKWLDESFTIKSKKDWMSLERLRISKKSSPNWHWKERDGFNSHRGKILERVAEQRAKREQFLLDTKDRISKLREDGKPIL